MRVLVNYRGCGWALSHANLARGLACLLLAILPLTSGCLTTLALTAASRSGVADEHIGPAREVAEQATSAARDTAENVADSAQDIWESWGE